MHTRTGCPMQHYTEMKVREWHEIQLHELECSKWKSCSYMGIRYKHDTGNTGTTIQVRRSTGICIAISSLWPCLLSYCCKLDTGSVPPSYHRSLSVAVQNSPTRLFIKIPASISLLCLQPSHLSKKFSSSTSSTSCALTTGPLLLLTLGHSIYQSKSLEPQFLPSASPRSSSASYN